VGGVVAVIVRVFGGDKTQIVSTGGTLNNATHLNQFTRGSVIEMLQANGATKAHG